MRNYGIIVAGPPGSGKSLTALSYHPATVPAPRRVVIDMEARIASYRAEEYDVTADDPARLLYSCEVYPPQDVITAAQFCTLYQSIRDKSRQIDTLMIDNIALFQDEMGGWCQNKATCASFLEVAGITSKFKTFMDYNFRVSEPNWYRLMKAVIKEFLMELRRNKIDFVATTELKNVWDHYGDKGKDEYGKPLQRILGKSAQLWDPWLQMCDATWNLSRLTADGKLTRTPKVELDRFAPKSSIVGVPPTFTFKDWDQVWEWEKTRGVTTQAQLDELKPPTVEYPEVTENGVPVEAEPSGAGGTEGKKPPLASNGVLSEDGITWGDVMTQILKKEPKGGPLTGKAKAMKSMQRSPKAALMELLPPAAMPELPVAA